MEQDRDPRPDLLLRTKELVTDILADFFKRPFETFTRQMAGNLTQYLLAITCFCVAFVFLLVALVLTLEKLNVESYVAYLVVGVVALLLGALIAIRKPEK